MNPANDPDLFSSEPPLGRTGAESCGQTGGPETFQHYQVLRRADGSLWELGRGAMGVTYKAFDTNLRCHVALKVISAQHLHSEMAGQRFIREARVAARLRHRNIASVYHLGVDPQSYFYSMEFIDGETLEDLVRRVGPLPLESVLGIAHQTARALAAASRQGLIHRDLKPANIMVLHQDEEGEDRLLVKVIDFGLARTYAADDSNPQLTATGFVGTPLYASPEQLEERPLDVRSDIYSLGITLWILLTGRPPFAGKMTMVITQHLSADPPWWQLGECPEPARALLERMLCKQPEGRYQTAGELRLAIEACLLEMTGKGAPGIEGIGPGGIGQSLSAPWSIKTDAGLTGSSSGTAHFLATRAAGTAAVAGQTRTKATMGASGVGEATRMVPGEGAKRGVLQRWATRRGFSLAGVGLALVGAFGVVSWHQGSQPSRGTRASNPGQALPLANTAKADTAMPALAAASLVPSTQAAGEPSGTRPVGATGSTETPPNLPGTSTVPTTEAPVGPPAQTSERAAPPPGEAFTPESRPLPEEGPSGTAATSPVPKVAEAQTSGDDDDRADDDGQDTSTKNHAKTSTHARSHHRAHSAPTPAPNFFQRMFGLKPKPKSKSN